MSQTKSSPSPAKKAEDPKDPLREGVETVVFVIVLVLMLQLFVAQAFVIPTGSMAETLYGHHKDVVCAQCGYSFPLNASREVEEGRQRVTGYQCPNCQYEYDGKLPSPASGDRVIVSKISYHLQQPERWQVPVFKFPGESQDRNLEQRQLRADLSEELQSWIDRYPNMPLDGPIDRWEPKNYIKRLIGKPGETIGIGRGDLFVSTQIDYPEADFPRPANPADRWIHRFMWRQQRTDWDYLQQENFDILRKPPEICLAMRRIVYDNDYQAKDLIGKLAPRWGADPQAPEGWNADDPKAPRVFTHQGDQLSYLRYQHLMPNWADPKRSTPAPITNSMGYNLYRPSDPYDQSFWVPDLMIECDVRVEDPKAVVVLELARGLDRFRARFDMAKQRCSLVRKTPTGEDILSSLDVDFRQPGEYHLRLANFDQRLTVWVDGDVLDFGDAGDYQPTPIDRFEIADQHGQGWVKDYDIDRPARIGVQGVATVSHVQLWRDTYYTLSRDAQPDTLLETYYVQPDCYFCLGDNSAASQDSREWGTVPNRLLIGRAVLVYWPWYRIGLIR